MKDSRLYRFLHTPVRMPLMRRRGAHVLFACVVWPALTILGAAGALMRMPYYDIGLREALLAGAAGTLIRLPDLLLTGAVVFGVSGYLFTRLGADARPGQTGSARLAIEPAATFLIMSAGIALWYPAVLGQPVFAIVGSLPVWTVLLLLAALGMLGVVVTGRPGVRLRLAAALFAIGLLSPAPLWLRARIEPAFGAAPSVVLLGIDSLSHQDDLSPLADWVRADGGTWYERAVAPGLFTNSVWTSILTQQPVSKHGVFHTFQRMPGTEAALLQAARSQGYQTVSMFPDQLTCAVGSTAGFHEDRSGPVGWRQLLLPMIANNSVLVPVVGAALPRVWPGASASNEAATFTYDVRRDVRGLLRAGTEGRPTFVAAHLTYAHLPAYPGTTALSADEFRAVLRAPAGRVRDRTIDWQDEDLPGDPLPLNRWKIRHVQQVVREEVEAAGFLRAGGRLVIFSDHGSRKGLTMTNFSDEQYHHVPLLTFGLAAQCPAAPVSLIDIGALMGFGAVHGEPAVEFTFADRENWPALVQSARLRWSGAVDLDERLLAALFADLRRHVPWPAETCGR